MMEPRTVEATPPDEPGWSFAALRTAFGASLGHWMRRFNVQPSDVEDAMQDALFEAWRDLATFPADKSKARFEMFRVASRVAQRYRRRAAKIVCTDELEVRDSRDIEAWIAARVLWLEALSKLDDRSRDLIIAYHIDGRTHKQMGAELDEKEDTIRKRVDVAEQKLRKQIEKLVGKDHDRKTLAMTPGLAIVFDPFDRATIRAILDVEDEFGVDANPISSVRPNVKTTSWPWQFVPLGSLAIALFLVPGQGWRAEPLIAGKMVNVALSMVGDRVPVTSASVTPQHVGEPLPGKTERPKQHNRPALSAEDAAIVKKTRGVGTPGSQ